MSFGSNMHKLGRLKEKQRDIPYCNKHRREIETLRSVKRSMKTCEGREGYRWRVGWLGQGSLDTSSKGKRLYRPGINSRPSGFQPSYPRFLVVEDLYCGILGFDTIQRGQWY